MLISLTARCFVFSFLVLVIVFFTGGEWGVCDLGRRIFATIGFLAVFEHVSEVKYNAGKAHIDKAQCHLCARFLSWQWFKFGDWLVIRALSRV